jgi:hypothetical protein
MNHRNAIPANGTRSSASLTALLRSGSTTQIPGSVESAGIAYRTSPKQTIMRTEKITPATAAPRGGARACLSGGCAVLVIGLAVLRYCVHPLDALGHYHCLSVIDQPTRRAGSPLASPPIPWTQPALSPRSEAANSAARKKVPLALAADPGSDEMGYFQFDDRRKWVKIQPAPTTNGRRFFATL